jgi:hypothetical protein
MSKKLSKDPELMTALLRALRSTHRNRRRKDPTTRTPSARETRERAERFLDLWAGRPME